MRVRTGWQRLGRALSWVLVVTSVLIVVTSVAGYAYVQHLDASISRLPATPPSDVVRPVETSAVNVLVAGVDTRDGQDPSFQGEGATHVTGSRPDSILLVHIAAAGPVTVLSFPRDSYVQIPAYVDASGHHAVSRHKLNYAGVGGPPLVVETIENLTGLRVDHYVQVDFAQFGAIVNALGGVEVCLTQPAHDSFSGIDLPAGTQTLTGAQALAFVRQRHGLPSDLTRINRQQRFASAILRKLSSSGTLLNPVRLDSVLTSLARSVTVDEQTSLDDLVQLGERFAALTPDQVTFETLPTTQLGYVTATDGEVVLLDGPASTKLFQALHDDRPPGTARPAPAAPVPSARAAAPVTAPAPVTSPSPLTAETANCGI